MSLDNELSEKMKRQVNQKPIHDSWENTYRGAGSERSFECCFDEIVSVLKQPAGSRALDIGCGICANSVRLARRGYNVTGADYSEAILEPARQNVAHQGLSDQISVQREDILALSFPADEFDLVLCFGVLMHIPAAEQALDELVRVAKPGGYVVFEEINRYSPEAYLMRLAWRTLRKGRITATVKPAGIEHTSPFAGEQLFWRHCDPAWLRNQMEARSCKMIARKAGVFSDLHIYARPEFSRNLIHGFNQFWIRRVGLPRLAYHNLFVFQKASE